VDASVPASPTCSDGVQNQDELAVDCGGSTCAVCDCTFGAPAALASLNASGRDLWSPTFSNDGLSAWFGLVAGAASEQIAVAVRPDRGDSFGLATFIPPPPM
jgi:hypothetical protein